MKQQEHQREDDEESEEEVIRSEATERVEQVDDRLGTTVAPQQGQPRSLTREESPEEDFAEEKSLLRKNIPSPTIQADGYLPAVSLHHKRQESGRRTLKNQRWESEEEVPKRGTGRRRGGPPPGR